MRIFLGTVEIAGFYTRLAEGFRRLGIEADCYFWRSHPFQYGSQSPRSLRFHIAKSAACITRRCRPWRFWFAVEQRARKVFLRWATKRYDVFVLGCNSSIVDNTFDLRYLADAGKKVIAIYHGSDARPPYIDGYGSRRTVAADVSRLRDLAASVKESLRTFEQWSTDIIVQPETAHFLSRKFVPWLYLGLPCDVDNGASLRRHSRRDRLSVLHCPSDPFGKGSPIFRRIIRKAQQSLPTLEYREITNQPNRVVMRALSQADLVLDQVYSDTPMAGFASEAGALGKPVLVGGYAANHITKLYPYDWIPPTCFCHPDAVSNCFERLIADDKFRADLAVRLQEFIRSRCSLKEVALRLLKVVHGDPSVPHMSPQQIRYVHGACIPQESAAETIRRLVDFAGPSALQLDDKPELRQAFLDFAYSRWLSGNIHYCSSE